MQNKKSKIQLSVRYVWLVFATGFLLAVVGSYGKIFHWQVANPLILTGLILCAATWLITLGDIISQEMREKYLWIVVMLAVPAFAPLLYLIRRDYFIKMNDRA